jgi:hypothetical protein
MRVPAPTAAGLAELAYGLLDAHMGCDGLLAFVVPPVSAADAFHHPFRYAP